MEQFEPQRTVRSLMQAAKIINELPCDIRDDASLVVKDLMALACLHQHEADQAKWHVCQDSWPRLCRMILALSQSDENAYELVVSELGTCNKCWNALLRLSIGRLISDSMLGVGGADKLADVVALERLVMP
jgi:hypothetical protein